jgi:Flp pilus assembly protein TadG
MLTLEILMKFDFLHRVIGDRRGNVAVTFGLASIPLIFAVGMAVDYANNADKWTKLNGAADAAALAAVTPAMLQQPDSAAKTAALNIFYGQANQISNVVSGSLQATVALTANPNGGRVATVSYTAQLINVFGGILGQSAMSVQGHSQAAKALSPNINFYVLADPSPSMAVAATTAGIKLLESKTPGQWGAQPGCAFACHEQDPSKDGLNNPGGPNQDNYALARQLGVPLRIDNVKEAVQSFATTADAAQSKNYATYNIAIYTFDSYFKTITSMTTPANAAAAASNIQLLELLRANYLMDGTYSGDSDTLSQSAFSSINGIMPSPGDGSTKGPKEFLLIITDGIEDDAVTGLMDTSMCAIIKNRNIQIGVVYTTYLPIPGYWPYDLYVAPVQSQINPNLASCASSPAYFYEVNADGDISAAVNAIFQSFVQTTHLTQ